MIQQNLLRVFRQINSRRFYFFLIASTLVAGFTSFILLSGFYLNERSYDSFQSNHNQLYRINFELYKEGKLNSVNASSCAPVAPTLYNQLEHVKSFVRLYRRSDGVNVKSNELDKWFPENAMYHADSTVFDLFQVKPILSESKKLLRKPFTAVISQSTSKKLFGEANPIGEKLIISDHEVYEIEGVFEDYPANSHLELNILLSFSTLELLDWSKEGIHDDWAWYSFYSYVLLDGNYDVKDLDQQIASVTSVYTKPIDERINGALRYTLFPFSKIYLESDLNGEMERKGSLIAVQVVTIVAGLFLLISIVNYLNLMSSLMMERSQETAIRYVLGTTKWDIFLQSLTEITIHLYVTGALGILAAYLLWDPFNQLIGSAIPFKTIFSVKPIAFYALLLLTLSVLASAYYTARNSISASNLSSAKISSMKGLTLSKAIITFQFFCAISMIIATLLMNDQVQFMEKRSTGFEMDNLLYLKIRRVSGDDKFNANLETIQQNLSNLSWVNQVSFSSLVPGQSVGWTSGGRLLNQETVSKIHNYGIDEKFVPLLKLELLTGDNFSSNRSISARSVLVNEEAMRAFGVTKPEDIISKKYLHGGDETTQYEVIGVLKDFHQRGLQYKVEPIVFHYLPDNSIYTGPAYLTIKLSDTESLASRLLEVEKVIQQVYPGRTLESNLLEGFYYRQYQTEKTILRTLGLFSILIILISCLGLIGLISFAALQRCKEIGVRKVLGASQVQIHVLIIKEYFFRMLVAAIIAVPVCYSLLNQWLSGFAYKTNLSAWPFIIGSCATILFSVIVISGYIWRFANINPIQAIRRDN